MAGPAAYIFLTGPDRLRPLLGGDDVLFDATVTYPPAYGAVGSYRPGSLTTGPPSGTKLTAVTASNTNVGGGATIDSKEFFGKVSLTGGADQDFTRCVFHGKPNDPNGYIVSRTGASKVGKARFFDCRFVPSPGAPKMTGFNGHDAEFYRCEFANVVDGIDPYNTSLKDDDSGIVLQQCWLHDFAYWTPDDHGNNQTHNDGIQAQGIHKVVMRGNYFQGYFGSVGSNPEVAGLNLATPTPAGAQSFDLTALLLNSSASLGTSQLHTFEDNWVDGFECPLNLAGAGSGVNLGSYKRNRFKGDSRIPANGLGGGVMGHWTILMRSDQIIDAGEGTADQNTFLDGTPIKIARNG